MPYKSAKQRRYMHAKHPEIAKRWDREYGKGEYAGQKPPGLNEEKKMDPEIKSVYRRPRKKGRTVLDRNKTQGRLPTDPNKVRGLRGLKRKNPGLFPKY